MTHLEATDLAVRILRVFNGPPADVWEEVLTELHANQAAAALRRVTREHSSRWLTIAEFMSVYRSLTAHATTPAVKPDHDGIGLSEYLAGLHLKAANGDQDAADELERWERGIGARA